MITGTLTPGQYAMLALEWVLVPIILLALIGQGTALRRRDGLSPRAQASARSGAWAGLIIFTIFVISQRSRNWAFSLARPDYGFLWAPGLLGLGAGFVLQFLIRKLRGYHIAVGGFALAQVAGGSIALFSYAFLVDASDRGSLAFAALGLALGAVMHEMLFPSGLPEGS